MQNYHKLSSEQKNEIVERAKNGESGLSLSREFGVGNTAIYRLLERRGVARPARKTKKELLDGMVALYVQGETIQAAAAAYGCDERTCSNELKRRGIETRPQLHDLSGKEFGYWTALQRDAQRSEVYWICRCVCGEEKSISRANLSTGATRSCGCRKNELTEVHPPPRKYSLNEDYFTNIDTPEKAFYLGWIYADGCISKEGHRLVVTLAKRDVKILEDFLLAIDSSAPISHFKATTFGNKERDYVGIVIYSKTLVNGLRSAGLYPNKSLTIPPWEGTPELMSHFWHGAWVGDGHIVKKQGGKNWEVGFCGNELMVKGFANFAYSVTDTKALPKADMNGRDKPLWRFSVGGRHMAKRFLEAMLKDAPVQLERKQKLAQELFSCS